MHKLLTGRVAVVTGAGRGIGRAEAIALAAEGAKLVVNDLGTALDGGGTATSPADEVVAEIVKNGSEAVASYDSVATPEGADRIIATAIDTFGKIDILVNNAGIVSWHMLPNMTDEEWDRIVKVHLYGHFYCSRAACRWFRQQKSGRIINTSSTTGLGMQGAIHYASAKEGIVGLTRSIALEMAKYNVTCNAIRPVAVTRMTKAVVEKDHPGIIADEPNTMESLFDGDAVNDIVGNAPEDIAPLVVFFASDEAAGITGRTFLVRRGEISLYREPRPGRTFYKEGRWTAGELVKILPNRIAAKR
ncbi:MAG: SDR family oxidoreductase [Anaerolineaceae bacterium]|nr:SDR family oxidoreductase [Anaerolineaceae bacterium]